MSRLQVGDLIPIGGDDYIKFMTTPEEVNMSKVVENIDDIIISEHALNVIISSPLVVETISNSQIAMEKVVNNETAIRKIASSNTSIYAMLKSKIARDAVINNSIAMNAVANSVVGRTALLSSDSASDIWSSEMASEQIWNSGTGSTKYSGTISTYPGYSGGYGMEVTLATRSNDYYTYVLPLDFTGVNTLQIYTQYRNTRDVRADNHIRISISGEELFNTTSRHNSWILRTLDVSSFTGVQQLQIKVGGYWTTTYGRFSDLYLGVD